MDPLLPRLYVWGYSAFTLGLWEVYILGEVRCTCNPQHGDVYIHMYMYVYIYIYVHMYIYIHIYIGCPLHTPGLSWYVYTVKLRAAFGEALARPPTGGDFNRSLVLPSKGQPAKVRIGEYVQINIYIYIYIHTCISICLPTYLSVDLHIHLSVYLFIYLCTYMHMYLQAPTHTYIYIYIHTYTHVCRHVYCIHV